MVRTSPRKHARLQSQEPAPSQSLMNKAIAQTKGKPRHCRRCNGRPLITDCAHGAKTRSGGQANPQTIQTPAFPGDAQSISAPTRAATALIPTVMDDLQENPFVAQSIPTAASFPRTPIRPRAEPLRFPPIMPFSSAGSRSSAEPASSPIPDNSARRDAASSDMTPSSDSTSPEGSPAESPGQSEVVTPPTSPENTSIKRLRAKKSDPIFGFVQGCHRGGGKVKIFCKRSLRPIQTHQASATSRYHEGIQDILGRAERLAVESSSWVMVLAQHPNAHKGCYYFLSPRMYKDGVAQKGLDLAQGFSDLTSSLIQARRKDAAALAADNEVLKRSLDEASAKEAELMQRIQALEARASPAASSSSSILVVPVERWPFPGTILLRTTMGCTLSTSSETWNHGCQRYTDIESWRYDVFHALPRNERGATVDTKGVTTTPTTQSYILDLLGLPGGWFELAKRRLRCRIYVGVNFYKYTYHAIDIIFVIFKLSSTLKPEWSSGNSPRNDVRIHVITEVVVHEGTIRP